MTVVAQPDHGHRLPRWLVEVVVVPKLGVNDPEGEAILGGLRSLGYSAVDKAQSGRFFSLTIAAEDEATAREDASKMANQLLANPVIQSFRIESVSPLTSGASAQASAAN